MYASSPSIDNPILQIRTFRPQHTCSSFAKRVYHCHALFLAEEYKEIFLSDSKWYREGVQSAVNRDFGMEIGYQLAYRAKARAAKLAQGTVEDQYNNLESYAHELNRRNPGTSVWIQTELKGEVARFKRIYICLAGLTEGWMAGCRPIIGLDECHLKAVHKGQLLLAVGIDGNNDIYPIGWAIVEQESRDLWTWFLSFLKEDLMIHHSSQYAFISDKQRGLEQAIKDLFPDAEHIHCVRHLHNNIKGDCHTGLNLKQRLWAVARAIAMTQYTKAMEDMEKTSFTTCWTQSCTCGRWDLCESFVAMLFLQSTPKDEWEHKEKKIAPPLYKRQPGRSRTKRTKEPGDEAPLPLEIEKLPRSYYSQVICGTCNKKCHNKRTCHKRNQVPNKGEVVQEEEPNAQQPVLETNMHQGQSPTEAPQPTQESNPQLADQVFSQASSLPNPQVVDQVFSQASSVPNIHNHSNHGNDNVNVNVNVNLNVHISMNEESVADNDSSMPSEHTNVLQENS
ncbi:uncharacterized protein LOC112184236 [Rosa chinensis]|uniref:uncharacterized protein LOC112184236 n=1 Tax=Rosa chinensis TaxID=74649 RepID=UPI000D093DD5|nr:uncharacterized protein LOC112184236 [Rosa chinensis]